MREKTKEMREADADYESELQIKLTHMKISKADYKKYIFWQYCEDEFLRENTKTVSIRLNKEQLSYLRDCMSTHEYEGGGFNSRLDLDFLSMIDIISRLEFNEIER